MNKIIPLTALLFCSPLSAKEATLTIPHILGKQALSERVSIELYATTKGALNYIVHIDGRDRGGSSLRTKTGDEAVFYWDKTKSTLWHITKKSMHQCDYSEPNRASSSGYSTSLAQAKKLKAPVEVMDIIKKFEDQ